MVILNEDIGIPTKTIQFLILSGKTPFFTANEYRYNGNVWRALVNNSGVQPIQGTTWTLQANSTQINTSRIITWNDYYSGHRGLLFWAALAKNHSKPFGIGEWGVWDQSNGGGDNPYYIQKMAEFLSNSSYNVAFHNYFDVFAWDGNHLLCVTPPG